MSNRRYQANQVDIESSASLEDSARDSYLSYGSNNTRSQSFDLLSLPPNDQDTPSSIIKSPASNSFKRFRVLIIGGIIALLSFVLVGTVSYVSMPQIAQAFMDGSSLSFTAITISQASDDGFNARIVGSISNAGPFNAQTSPMDLTISYDEQDIGMTEMPALELVRGSAEFDVSSKFKILNITSFNAFSKQLMTGETFVWHITGATNLTAMGMELTDLQFDKQITLAGMNGFSGVAIKDFALFGNDLSKIMTNITNALTNPSKISMQLDRIDLDMMYQGRKIGQIQSENVTIASGENILQLSGELINSNKSDTEHLSELFSNFVTGQPSTVQATGSSSQTGQIGWLQYALSQMNLNIDLKPPENMTLIKNIGVSGMYMDFSGPDYLKPSISISNITVDFEMPFKFPISIKEVKQDFQVYNASVMMGGASSQYAAASNELDPNVIKTSLSKTPMTVPTEAQEYFGHFLTDLFTRTGESFLMKGTAGVKAETALGLITLSGVPFTQSIAEKGMQGLNYIYPDGRVSNPIIQSLDVTKGEQDRMLMSTGLILHSPSSVGVNLGDVTLQLFYKEHNVGYSLLRNLIIMPGDNNITCETIFIPLTPEDRTVGQEMISNYVNGQPSQMMMVGTFDSSTQNLLLRESISKLALNAPLLGLTQPIVQHANLNINLLTVMVTKKGSTSFLAANPFNDQFTITGMNASITYKGKQLTQIEQSNIALAIPPKSTATTPEIGVTMMNLLSGESISAMGNDVTNSLKVDVDSQIDAKVGEYAIHVAYQQKDLPASIV